MASGPAPAAPHASGAARAEPEAPGRPSSAPVAPLWPSRFLAASRARQRFGARVDELGAALSRGDPLADAVVEAFAALPPGQGTAMLERALGRGIDAVSDAPAPLRALFAALDEPPPWVDRDALSRGGEVLVRAGWLGGAVLGGRSIVLGYASPAGNKPLAFSGRLTQQAPRRLAETSRFVEAVTAPFGMHRTGEGFAITVKVRLMHAAVRRMLSRSPAWRAEAWGLPINQHDMAATTLLFSLVVLDGLRTLGVRVDEDEGHRYMQLFRYVGHVIGVEPGLVPTSEAEATELAYLIDATQGRPDDDARALTAALLRSPLAQASSAPERARAERVIAFGSTLCRALLGDVLADELGVPPLASPLIVPAVRALAGAASRLERVSPSARALALERGRGYWRTVVRQGRAGGPYDFAMPRSLARL
jgi:hypothetical protein